MPWPRRQPPTLIPAPPQLADHGCTLRLMRGNLYAPRCDCGWEMGPMILACAEWYWRDHLEMERARIADSDRKYR